MSREHRGVPPASVRPPRRRCTFAAFVAAELLATALLAACGSSNPTAARHTPTTATSSSTTTPSPSTGVPATITPPGRAPATTTLTEHDNTRTVGLHVGEHLRVVLASTYWTFQPSSNPTVLHLDQDPLIAPRISGCVPGQGCGTVTADFTADATGTASVTATRTTCGEAMTCTPANRRYQVTITVT
jgi:hypothetical protein